MILTCYIVDDQPATVQLLELYINANPELHLVGVEQDPELAIKQLLKKEVKPDIIFLDIEMPVLTGLDMAGLLKDYAPVIFITGHRHFGAEAFNLNAVDYILKPFSNERFLQSIEKAKQRIAHCNNALSCLFIQDAGRNEKVKILRSNILYIERLANYTKLVSSEKEYLTLLSLKDALAMIADLSFMRVHKSFVVNIEKIETIAGDIIKMENGRQLPLGRAYKEAFMKKIG